MNEKLWKLKFVSTETLEAMLRNWVRVLLLLLPKTFFIQQNVHSSLVAAVVWWEKIHPFRHSQSLLRILRVYVFEWKKGTKIMQTLFSLTHFNKWWTTHFYGRPRRFHEHRLCRSSDGCDMKFHLQQVIQIWREKLAQEENSQLHCALFPPSLKDLVDFLTLLLCSLCLRCVWNNKKRNETEY